MGELYQLALVEVFPQLGEQRLRHLGTVSRGKIAEIDILADQARFYHLGLTLPAADQQARQPNR